MAKGTLNKVLLIGRLGQDPEISHTQGGQAVASFSIATNESWRDKEGNKKYTTEVIVNPFGGIQILGSSGRDGSGGEPMNQEPKVSEEDTSQVQEDDLPF